MIIMTTTMIGKATVVAIVMGMLMTMFIRMLMLMAERKATDGRKSYDLAK